MWEGMGLQAQLQGSAIEHRCLGCTAPGCVPQGAAPPPGLTCACVVDDCVALFQDLGQPKVRQLCVLSCVVVCVCVVLCVVCLQYERLQVCGESKSKTAG